MVAGVRRWSGRQRGSPARQRNSSLLGSARQLQALVRPLAVARPLALNNHPSAVCKEGKLDKYDRAENLEDKESADPGTEPPEHYLPLVRIVIRVQLLYPAVMLPRRRAN